MKAARLLCVTSLLPSSCLGTAITTNDQQLFSFPDAVYRYQLEDFGVVNGTVDIEKRKDVKVCEYIARTANCLSILSSLTVVGQAIATKIKSLSNDHDCGVYSGTVGSGSTKVQYRYQSSGRGCDTTAERKTIQGALEHHIRHQDNGKLCGTECLELNHGGTWDGYLLIGLASQFDNKMYCGPKLDFKRCDKGGKHDIG